MVQLAANIWADGPTSAPSQPYKPDIRSWGTWVEGIINAFTSNGGLIYTSRAALFADLAYAAPAMAWVLGDTTTAYNGIYVKSGASGVGSWNRVGDLPYSFIVAADAGVGTANAIQATSTIPVSGSALVVANIFYTTTAFPVTIQFNGGPVLTVQTASGVNIPVGGLTAGMLVAGYVSGSTFRLTTDISSAAIQAAAAASAAAAAASAAGVSLPAVTANTMLVDNSIGTARQAKTFSQVMAFLSGSVSAIASLFALDDGTLYKARSLVERFFARGYALADEKNYTSGGVVATNAAVLQALYNRIQTAGKPARILLPAEVIKLETQVNLVGSVPVQFIGQGDGVTVFENTSAGQVFFSVGDLALALTKNIVFKDLSTRAAVAMNSSGSMFRHLNTSDIYYRRVTFLGAACALDLASTITGVDNSAVYTFLEGCGGTSGFSAASPSPAAFIHLGSSGILHITGGGNRWNGNGGHNFIEHDNPSRNHDGIYIIGQFFENWLRYIYSHGKGIVNLEWTGGQMDRAAFFFHAQPDGVIVGTNNNWLIHDTQFLGFGALDAAGNDAGGIGVFLAPGASGGQCFDVQVSNNKFKGLRKQALFAAVGSCVKFIGNQIVNCGNSGTDCAHIESVGSGGFISISNNDIYLGPSPYGSNYTYGLNFTTSTTPTTRFNENNHIITGSSGTVNGTA